MATSPVKDFLVTYLMPEKCYQQLFINLHFHVPCLTFVLNKVVGLGIILDVFLTQVFQLLKILWRRSADGLSLTSVLLQLYSFSCPALYAVTHSFPLFAWGERLLMLVQTAAIVFLILHYRGDTLKGMLFLLSYSGFMFLLGSYAPAAVISGMQTSSLAALIASKGFQVGTNYSNGHKGQLSTLSVLLSWEGSLGLLFVSLQDSGSSLATMSHMLLASLTSVLLVQVLCYRSSSAANKQKSE